MNVALAASGTKLFLQPRDSRGGVLDLTWQPAANGRVQYVDLRDLAIDGAGRQRSHNLPSQRFVSIHDGVASVVDDSGRVQAEYPAVPAIGAAISDDGAVLYVRPDRSITVCGETDARPRTCRDLPVSIDAGPVSVSARSIPALAELTTPLRFLVLSGADGGTRVVNPERTESAAPAMSRTDASLRAYVSLHQIPISDQRIASLVKSLMAESAGTQASPGEPIADWTFFGVAPDEELYAPVLQFARQETVFPSRFEIVAELSAVLKEGVEPAVDRLYERYLRIDTDVRRRACTIYFRTRSTPGAWVVEYWLYYPFDIGGLGPHLHDPEHVFTEVDKLGSRVSRVIGAGHGYVAGNNMYSADRVSAFPATLPLFAIVELGKHATAPDMDRDGVFTPGLDENAYGERAKIWGVRDVIGTINNQLLAYDTTMSLPRRPAESLALASATTRFPAAELEDQASCQLERITDAVPDLPVCHEATAECAKRHVTSHPDFRNPTTILKEWVFPRSFLRGEYVLGPRRGLKSGGISYFADLDSIPGLRALLPLPGRVGGEVFFWRQDVNAPDRDSCLANCDRRDGVGFGVRYEQFLSNLFGIFSSVRLYSPPISDAWITFGPMVEVPLFNRSNATLEGGLSFRPAASPRFELRVSAGLWKPRSVRVGMRASGKDDGS
ncbi:MAG TPA: hypothetical protein VIK60_00380 [Vicinamibacterales bacterium]